MFWPEIPRDVEGLRKVDSVPGFYGVRFEGPNQPESLISRHNKWADFELRHHGQADHVEPVTLDGCLAKFRSQYAAKYPDRRLLDEPALVVGNPDDMSILMLAEGGLLVACSKHFVAGFSERYGHWFLSAVALDPGKYFWVNNIPGKRIVASHLEWDTKSLGPTFWVQKNEELPSPTGSQQDLIPARQRHIQIPTADLTRIWVVAGSGEIKAETADCHIYGFKKRSHGWAWMAEQCPYMDTLDLCHLGHFELEISDDMKVVPKQFEIDDFV